ncbi:FAD-binding oxidoreductase [Sulfitobacter sp. F26169L]|uniref:FAD-binding oxidoreductase n=1 Tax=Sulfitobacter sp. F26169L TaxID=2996015 RepID=UPI002260CD06|nr:FAD-binding oxidoreductase [Sulfitobacter sp. F26169L]MCX7567517.1 FAD-binding oxidoreductase [Sulfitobacter sp. F26169L]
MILSGWGRYPVLNASVHAPRSFAELQDDVRTAQSVIARGNGRAYGDSAINTAATIKTRHLNRMLAFDPETGQLIAEPGVLLGDIIAAFLSRGWFLPVAPGTKFVSLGGAIAADVHGKNHHKDGSFRNCVDWVDVMDAQGAVTRCSGLENPVLFDHTLGGMGLTGVITRAAIRLRSVETAWMVQTTYPAANLKAAMDIFEANLEASYSVAWIDCLATGSTKGRSLVTLGEHARLNDLPKDRAQTPFDVPNKRTWTVPFEAPGFALNKVTARAFNALYYRTGSRKAGQQIINWDSFFFPLDAILHWNRIYGRKGFAQFQCVLPLGASQAGISALLSAIAKAEAGVFLAVLKRFGPQRSAFSFPMEGYTLALDFPINPRSLRLLTELDRITLDHGGRFYLAKDARMSADVFAASDKRIEAFRAARQDNGWKNSFASAQSQRLIL